MKRQIQKFSACLLSILMVLTALVPGMTAFAADNSITITDSDGNEVTTTLEIQEYRSETLKYVLSGTAPDGSSVKWESNLPLLADVDDSGKVTAYDYSKKAIIQQWLDQNIKVLPIVGDTMAEKIMTALEGTGADLDDMNNDLIVSIVRGIAGDTLADGLKKALDNMNVEISATLYASNGSVICKDVVSVVVTKSVIASVAPTGVHITNKKTVPKTVALGATVQLYGAVTPVRLGQSVKWTMGSSIVDLNSKKYAKVSSSGLVTFTAIGECTVRANPTNDLYAAFQDTVKFNVVSRADLPVKDFSIAGTTTVNEGETTQLSISNLNPAGAYTGDVKWTVADPNIAAVDQTGKVIGLDGGSTLLEYSKSTVVTATTGGVSKSVTVKVNRTGITGSLSAIEIVGDSAIPNNKNTTFTSELTPARLNTSSSVTRNWGLKNGDNIVWATENAPASNSLASITSNGVLTPKSTGVITIAASATVSGSSVSTTKEITMGNAITDFSISGDTTVAEDKTITLSIGSIAPSDYDEALLDNVKWTSSDPTIASVTSKGVVRGLDCGGGWAWDKQTCTITATINGISKSVTMTVKNAVINYVTSANISGSDYVVKDFPAKYDSSFTPKRRDISKTLWGLVNNDGSAPWQASNTLDSNPLSKFEYNQENDIASITTDGVVTGKKAGKTKIYLYGRHLLTDYAQTTKNITVTEVEPESITVTPPTKIAYTEGDKKLDLTGMKVKLTYNREKLSHYYSDASKLTDAQLTVDVSDYNVSEINQSIFDTEQYIVVSVDRAGKTYRGVFAITLASKALTSIDITNPQYKYLEGVKTLDLKGLSVKANYSNADSETVTDYTVDTASFNPEALNEEQNITVTYSHAGRTASKTFPVIVYGIPVVSVDKGDYTEGWTSKNVTFTLDSTNKLSGATTYYYKTDSGTDWTAVDGNTFTVSTNSSDTYYFKAKNSADVESASTEGFTVNRDDVKPEFKLTQDITDVTNQSYTVSIDNLQIGKSGIKSITVNGADNSSNTSFTVEENGDYKVCVTAKNGIATTHTVSVTNIDKEKPVVNNIKLENKNGGGFARLLNTITFGKFFNQQIEITISAADKGVAGIGKIEYRFLDEKGLPVNSDWQVYDENNKPVQDPNFKGYVEARATDKAENVSDCLRSDGYVIDGDNPTDVLLNATYNGKAYQDGSWVAGSVQIGISSTAFSDIYEYRYRIDGGEWKTITGDSVTADVEGVHTYEFKSISNSALDSEISTIVVKIDRQQPVVRVDFEGTFARWTGDNVTFDFATLEDSISGITYYYNNGSGWIRIGTGDTIVLTENVNATYQFMAVNGAGTKSNPSDSYKVMIDNIVPTIKATPTVTDNTTNPYEVNITTSAGASGVKSVSLNDKDITGQESTVISQNGNYLFTVTGNNGKTSTYLLSVDNFVNPVLEISAIDFSQVTSGSFARKTDGEFGTFYKEDTEVTISASSNSAVISKVEYRLLNELKEPVGEWAVYDNDNKPVLTDGFKGYVEAKVYDNKNAVSESFISDSVVIDESAVSTPVVTATVDGKEYKGEWAGSDISIELNSSANSGIFEYMYRTDGGEWQSIKGNTLKVNDNGEHMYEFKAISNSTIESATSTFGTKSDTTAPILQVGVDGTLGKKTSDRIEFTLFAPNALSEITYYYNNGSGWNKLDGNSLVIGETINADYKFKAVNSAGVESLESPAYKVVYDKAYNPGTILPVVSIGVTGTIGQFTSKSVTFTLVSSNTEGNVTYYYNDGTGFKSLSGDTLTVDENTDTNYTFKVIDSENRESIVSCEYNVKIDKNAPTDFTVNASVDGEKYVSGDKTSSNISVSFSANAYSGIARYYYSVDGSEWVAVSGDALTISELGTHSYKFKAISESGMSSEIKELKTDIYDADSANSVIKGTVESSGYIVTLMQGDTVIDSINTNGDFEFDVPDGDYTVIISKPSCTSVTINGISIVKSSEIDLSNIISQYQLGIGDVDGNGIVDVKDIALILLTVNYSKDSTVVDYGAIK